MTRYRPGLAKGPLPYAEVELSMLEEAREGLHQVWLEGLVLQKRNTERDPAHVRHDEAAERFLRWSRLSSTQLGGGGAGLCEDYQ